MTEAKQPRIDLNCDMGELPEAIADGTQNAILRSVTSANVACGGHAGDPEMMRVTVEQSLQAGVAIGGHPGYPDREHFGRLELHMSLDSLSDSVCRQLLALLEVAGACKASVAHVKPHGALYNQAVKDGELASAIARGVREAFGLARPGQSSRVTLVGLAGSRMLDVFREAGFPVAAEAFADRRYEPDGTLRSRKFADALIEDPAEAARQALHIVERGCVIALDGTEVRLTAQTICIHGDSPGAAQIAASVASTLRRAGVSLQSLG